MVKVLKAREDLAYQLALLSTELAEIFANAPANPQSPDKKAASLTTDTGGSRKPIDSDCPVCAMEFDTSDKCEDIIWCKAACGQNIHRSCFEQWARSKPGKLLFPRPFVASTVDDHRRCQVCLLQIDMEGR